MNPLLIFGALVGYYYWSKYKASGKLQLVPTTLKIQEGKLYFVLDVTNPTQTPLAINNVFLSFYDGTNYLGKIQQTQKIDIPKAATTTLYFPITFNAAGLIYFAANILTGKSKSVQYTGSINSEGIDVPLSDNIEIL